MAQVVLKGLRKSFGAEAVIRDLDLTVPDGKLTVFVGPSGCGKSTLLRLIAGLEDPDSGEIRIADRRVNEQPPARRGIAMVFQSYALYPHMSVFDNMAFGLKLERRNRAAIRERVLRAAAILRIEDLLERRPRELSGGQRQRVAIGRAITREPAVFLFDEPLSNLDAALRVQMRLELADLQRRLGATMIYVTHDQVEAMTLGEQIVVLNRGRIEQAGAPMTLYQQPANRFVAGFLGSPTMNFVEVTVAERQTAATVVALPGGERLRVPIGTANEHEPLTLGIRPEHLALSGEGAPIHGTVALVERLGNESHLHVQLAGDVRLTARLTADLPLTTGESVTLRLDPGQCHLFGADGRRR